MLFCRSFQQKIKYFYISLSDGDLIEIVQSCACETVRQMNQPHLTHLPRDIYFTFFSS